MKCSDIYNCCDCGDGDCGCAYCFSCNACENCRRGIECCKRKNKYAIMEKNGIHLEIFKISAPSYIDAMSEFKKYGQYNSNKTYLIYDVLGEDFSTMSREDFSLITEF
jgi:hypothetical protein